MFICESSKSLDVPQAGLCWLAEVLTNTMLCCLSAAFKLSRIRLFLAMVWSVACNTICNVIKWMQVLSNFSDYFPRHKRHNLISLNTLILSSPANMFHRSIVTTFYHSQILIWIRLSHVRGLRELSLFFLYSPLTHSPPITSPCCLLTGPLMCLL